MLKFSPVSRLFFQLRIAGSLIVCFYAITLLPGQTNLFYGLSRDTMICDGEYLRLIMDRDVYNPDDTCFGTPVWWDGNGGTNRRVFTSGEYWVYKDEFNCPYATDTINVLASSCGTQCNTSTGHSGLFSFNAPYYTLSNIAGIPDGSGYYVQGTVRDSTFFARIGLSGKMEWLITLTRDLFTESPSNSSTQRSLIIDREGMIVASLPNDALSNIREVQIVKFNPIDRVVVWLQKYTMEKKYEVLTLSEDPFDGHYLISTTAGVFKADRTDGEILPAIFTALESEQVAFNDIQIHDGYLYACGPYKKPGEIALRLMLTKIDLSNGQVDWSFYSDSLGGTSIIGHQGYPQLLLDGNYIYCATIFKINRVERIQILKVTLDGVIVWCKDITLSEFDYKKNGGPPGQPSELIKVGSKIVLQLQIPSEDIVLVLERSGTLSSVFAYSQPCEDAISHGISSNAGQIVFIQDICGHPGSFPELPHLLFGRIDTLGNVLNTCMYSRIPEVTLTNVENTDYFPFALPFGAKLDRNAIELFPEIYPSFIYEFPACRALNLIYTYQTHDICPDQMIEGYTIPGVYADTFPSAQGCDSIRILTLIPGPAVQTSAKVTICAGDSYEGYDISGIYTDTLQAASGCDSIHTLYLTVTPCLPIVHYGLDACTSFMSNGSHMDYSEFLPVYPNELACVTTAATILHREPASMQKHSCTPGLLGTEAMCISVDTSCTYNAGSSSSLVFEVDVTPSSDSIMALTGLTFFQKAPLSYNWIDGDTGPNDYPTRYGLRVLRDNIEIYSSPAEETSLDWTEESFSFIDDSLFVNAESALYRFEFLPYCPVGNGAEVKAWDIEDVRVYGACLPRQIPDDKITGQVYTVQHQPLKEASLYLRTQDPTTSPLKATSDAEGRYSFPDLKRGGSYTLKGYDNKDHLKGVSTMDILRIHQHLLGKSLFTHQWQYIAGDVDRNQRINVVDMIELRKTILGILPGFPGNTSWRFGTMPQQEDVPWLERFEEKAYIEQINGGIAAQDFIGIKVGDVNGDIQIRQRTESILGEDEMKTLKLRAIEAEDESTCVWQVSAGEPLSFMGLQMALDIPEVDEVSIQGVGMSIKGEDYYWDGHQLRVSWTQDIPIDLPEGSILYRIEAIGPGCAGDVWPVPAFLNENISAEIYSGLLETNGLLLIPEVNEITSAKDENVQTIVVYPNPFEDELQIRWHHAWYGPVVIRLLDISGREWYLTKASAPQGGEGSVQIDSAVIGRMPPGLYLVEVRADSGRWIGKIVRM
jgi:hypothetical protein